MLVSNMDIEKGSTPKINNSTYPLVLITNAIFASAGRKKCPLALAALFESISSLSSLAYSAAYFLALSVAAFLAATRSFLACSRLVLRTASNFASLACFLRIFSGTLFALKQNTQGDVSQPETVNVCAGSHPYYEEQGWYPNADASC